MSADPASEALRLLREAYESVPEDAARTDPRLAAIRYACRIGIEASMDAPPQSPIALATFGETADRRQRWIIRFEDAEVPDAVYDARIHGEARAEMLARAAFREAEGMWNCHLLRIAAIDPADEERQRARADRLEREITALRDGIGADDQRAEAGENAIALLTKGTVPFLAERILRSHAKHLEQLNGEIRRHERSQEAERRYLQSNPEDHSDLSEQDREDIATSRRYASQKSATLARDLALAERVQEAWRKDPASLLLPIGTMVRTRSIDMLPDDWPLPIPGTVGVVVGYSDMRSRPNVVAFMGKVEMTAYDAWHGDEDRAVYFNYLPDEIEILEAGSVVDTDEPVDVPGWRPTHGHGREGAVLYSESMVVRSNGFLWRVQPCPDLPQCTQITIDDEGGRARFSHLHLLSAGS